MDDDHDGQVNFSEFQRYASAQADSYDKSRISSFSFLFFSLFSSLFFLFYNYLSSFFFFVLTSFSSKTSSNHRTFSGGDIAAAVLVTLVGTLLIGGAVLLGVAQYLPFSSSYSLFHSFSSLSLFSPLLSLSLFLLTILRSLSLFLPLSFSSHSVSSFSLLLFFVLSLSFSSLRLFILFSFLMLFDIL